MKRVEAPSYPVSIFMAAPSVWDAELVCLNYCGEVGLCVTVTPTNYIYGNPQVVPREEAGIIIGLINYPRFPLDPATLFSHAEALARRLRDHLHQDSYTIQTPDKTVWFSHRPEDNA